MLLKIAVQCRSTGQVLNILDTVQTETVNYVQCGILHLIEVAVVAVTRYNIAVLLIPLGVLDTNVLGRNHLTVEHYALGAVLLVQLLYDTQNGLYILCVTRVVTDLDTQELGTLNQTVYTDCQILTAYVDVA